MNRFKYILLAAVMSLTSLAALAQERVIIRDTTLDYVIPEGYELVDTIIYTQVASADSSLVGKNIFDIMPSRLGGSPADVKVSQSVEIREGMERHIQTNSERHLQGYRVRIFFDNRQTARTESEKAVKEFTSKYHGIPAYRSYTNPYFKVTVGDFRTRSEAVELMKRIQYNFPSAFIVRENIEYPVVDKTHSYTIDTLKVIRKIADEQIEFKE